MWWGGIKHPYHVLKGPMLRVYLLWASFQSCSSIILNWPLTKMSRQPEEYMIKGRLADPLSMNFWKSSKRPLTPPPRAFFGKNVAIFCYENFWNGKDPPKLASQMLKILQRNFLDRKWPPPPLELFQKFIDNGTPRRPLPWWLKLSLTCFESRMANTTVSSAPLRYAFYLLCFETHSTRL